MEILADRLSILIGAGIAILCLLVSTVLFRINKRKGSVAFFLSFLLALLLGYYAYLPFMKRSSSECEIYLHPVPPSVSATYSVAVDVDGELLLVEADDFIEVGRRNQITVLGVKKNGKDVPEARVNVIGFTPQGKPNAINDIGAPFVWKDMQQRFADDIEKRVFRAEIWEGDNLLGEIYLKFSH